MMTSQPRTDLEQKPSPDQCWEFRTLVQDFAAWNEDRTKNHKSRTRDGTGEEVFAGDSTPIARVDPKTLALVLLRRGVIRKIQPQGIELWDRTYQAPWINRHTGILVELGWPGDSLDKIAVFRAGARAEDPAAFLGWAKVEGTLSLRAIGGLASSKAAQRKVVATAEQDAELLRLALAAAERSSLEAESDAAAAEEATAAAELDADPALAAAPPAVGHGQLTVLPDLPRQPRSDPLQKRRGAAHAAMMARRSASAKPADAGAPAATSGRPR